MKRAIVTVVAAGLLVLGSAGVAGAQQTGGSTSPSTQGPNPTAHSGARRHRGAVGSVLRVTAKTLGVKPRDLLSGLCSGKTVAQLASDHGKSAADVINALVAAANQRIDKAVQAGRLDATKAAQRKSQVQARVTNLVNNFHASTKQCQRLQGGGAGATTPTSST